MDSPSLKKTKKTASASASTFLESQANSSSKPRTLPTEESSLSVLGHTPQVHPSCFVATGSKLIGQVRLGEGASIWFQCVLRGDVMPIEIGARTNIQDGSIIHGSKAGAGRSAAATRVGEEVTVGHGVILHGCTIGDRCLIGMGSIVMDHAQIESEVIVGAGSLVVEGQKIPSGHLALGRPAKVVRPLTEDEKKFLRASAQNYIEYSSWYLTDSSHKKAP